jgi:hypothetical protein
LVNHYIVTFDVGSPVYQYQPERPITPYTLQDVGDAILTGKSICVDAAISIDPLTYVCANTGGLGAEYGASYGNGSIVLFLFAIWFMMGMGVKGRVDKTTEISG